MSLCTCKPLCADVMLGVLSHLDVSAGRNTVWSTVERAAWRLRMLYNLTGRAIPHTLPSYYVEYPEGRVSAVVCFWSLEIHRILLVYFGVCLIDDCLIAFVLWRLKRLKSEDRDLVWIGYVRHRPCLVVLHV